MNKNQKQIREPEIVETIAEMIEKYEYDPNVIHNPRTKKQIQIFLSRNAKVDKHDQKTLNPIESTNDQKHCQSIQIDDKIGVVEQSPIKAETSIQNCEPLDEKCGDRSRFEEIENKLEEMFAGIEDEHLTDKGSNDTSANNINKEVKSITELGNINILSSDCNIQGSSASNKSSLPTKAAMKSTVTFPKNASRGNDECRKNIKSFQHLRTVPNRRRLSTEINSEHIIKNNEKINHELQNVGVGNVIKNNFSPSKKLSLQKSQVIKDHPAGALNSGRQKLNKITNNNKRCKQYKDNNRNNKQKQKNYINKTAKNKYKQGQRFISSDNDEECEEKTQNSREIDNKNRSPFILVNPNGNVTVVNTLMQDEFNEKYTKTKIPKSFGFERSTVKGCHSSTLSNRYDADKADSSWICVFCKKGPHKKGLGDLFGPYIVSTDCDEYQSYKDLIDFSSKKEKSDLAFFTELASNGSTHYNKTVKHLYDNSLKSRTFQVLDMSKKAETHSIPSYSLGMIKISECSYEVWIHEDCAVWAPNIFIIGSRLTGLQEAIWNSTGHECCYCLKPGALLCCLQRDCKIMAHLPCAREADWLIDESSYSTLCKKHFQTK